jgi:Uncharacterized protein conserved in bacteria (DUF2188)
LASIKFARNARKKWTNSEHNAIHGAAIVTVKVRRIRHWETQMAKLAKYTLSHDDTKKRWVLKNDASGQAVKSFATKAAATKGGVLERAVGKSGSVKIKKRNGKIQEERTYPRSADPRGSKG